MKAKTKNRVLKTITGAAIVGYVLGSCFLDSESNVPLIVCAFCVAWLALFAVANTER